MAEVKGKSRTPHFSDRLRPGLSLIALMLFGAVLGIGVCGCWLAALPLAINVAEGVGSAVANVAIGTVVAAHQGSGKPGDEDHAGESEMDREDRCQQLQLEVPGVIELRKSAAGAAEYRELQLGGSLDHPQWTALVDKDTDPDGWRPAVNFLQMNFTPPLGPLPDAGSDFLAYRLMHSESSVPEVEFVPLTLNFGKTQGTFRWNGSLYQFALGHALPCFPPPA
jgi:hypothetical protein